MCERHRVAHRFLPCGLGQQLVGLPKRAGAEKARRVISINVAATRSTQQNTRWRFLICTGHQQAPQMLQYGLAGLHCRPAPARKGRPKPPPRLGGHAAVRRLLPSIQRGHLPRLNRHPLMPFRDGRRLSRCLSTASYANIAEVEYTSPLYSGLRLHCSFSIAVSRPKVPGEKGGRGVALH